VTPRADQRFVLRDVARGGQRFALADEFGDGAFGIENALALHFGRVRGQHRRDVGVRQRLHDLGGADVGLREALEGHRERAFLQVALALVVVAPAHVVAVFGDVREVREVAERANHAHCLIARQVLQQAVERAAGLRVALQAVGDRELADALDQVERNLAFLLADHVAEDATEQPDVVDQRLVLRSGVVGESAARRFWGLGKSAGKSEGWGGGTRHDGDLGGCNLVTG